MEITEELLSLTSLTPSEILKNFRLKFRGESEKVRFPLFNWNEVVFWSLKKQPE